MSSSACLPLHLGDSTGSQWSGSQKSDFKGDGVNQKREGTNEGNMQTHCLFFPHSGEKFTHIWLGISISLRKHYFKNREGAFFKQTRPTQEIGKLYLWIRK